MPGATPSGNVNPNGDLAGDSELGSGYSQVLPNTPINEEQTSGVGQGTYGNDLTVPTGLTDPNGHNIQFAGVAQGLNQANLDAAGQKAALAQLQQIAAGGGPSLAATQLAGQTQQAIAGGADASSAGSGSSGLAARRNAIMAQGQALSGLQGNAATARNAEQLGAASQAGALASNIRGQDIGTAQAFDTAAQGQGELNMGQAQLAAQQSQFAFGEGMQLSQAGASALGGAALTAGQQAAAQQQPAASTYSDAELGGGLRRGTRKALAARFGRQYADGELGGAPAQPWAPTAVSLDGTPAAPIVVGDQNVPAVVAAPAAPTPPPAAPPAFDPSAIDALYKRGQLPRDQYERMGGQLPPNVRGQLTPAEASTVADAPPAVAVPGTGTGIREPVSVQRVQPVTGVPYAAASSAGQPGAAPALPPVVPDGLSGAAAIDLAKRGMGGGAGRVVGEHWQPTARSTQTHEGIHDPAADQALADAQAAEAEGAKAGTDLAMAQIADDAAKKQRLALVDEANATQTQLLRDSQTSQLAEQKGHIESLMRDASSGEINPNKWWDDKTTASKVLTGIGMALRGWVFGTTGRGDPAEWINQQIGHSVAAQQAKLAQSRAAVTDATNVYSMMRDKFGDDDRAALAAQMAQRQNIISGLDAKAATENMPAMERVRAQQIAAELRKSQAQDRMAWDEKTADRVVTAGQERFVPKQIVGGGPTDIVKLLERAQKIKSLSDSLSGSDPDTLKKKQDLEKTWAETQAEIAKTQAATGPNAQQLGAVAKEEIQAGLPTATRNINRARELVSNQDALGNIRGTMFPAMRTMAVGGHIGDAAFQAASPSNRELLGTLRSLAEAKAHANGQRGLESIQYNLQSIVGNGSREDVLRGIKGVEEDIAARKAAISAGVNPSTAAEYERRMRGAGADVPAGFEPGAQPNPEPQTPPEADEDGGP